jgi:hypothetical protein
MGKPTSLFSERVAIVAAIDPDAYTANTYTSSYVKADKFCRYALIGMLGDESTSGSPHGQTIFSVVQANTSGGGAVKAVALKTASVTMAADPTSEENQQCIINIDPVEDLDLDNGFYWIAARAVVSGDTCDAAVVLVGLDPRYSPASDNDSSAVNEIVS